MPAKKKKPAKQVATAAKTSGGALKKAWKTPDKRDGLSFKDTVLVLVIAFVTFVTGYYIGSLMEKSRSADLISNILIKSEESKQLMTEQMLRGQAAAVQ